MSEADQKPSTTFNIEGLNAIGARLFDRADAITAVACQDLAEDLRLAARIADKLASLRLRVAEIAEKAVTQDPGATARDLREALADAEG